MPPSRFTVTTCSPVAWRSSPLSPAGSNPVSLLAGRRSPWCSRQCWTTRTRVPATSLCRWIAARPNPSAVAFTLPMFGWCSARSPFSQVTNTHTNAWINILKHCLEGNKLKWLNKFCLCSFRGHHTADSNDPGGHLSSSEWGDHHDNHTKDRYGPCGGGFLAEPLFSVVDSWYIYCSFLAEDSFRQKPSLTFY